MNNKNLLFIPVYNCEKQIVRVIKKFFDNEKNDNIFDEVIIIDNGSQDETVKEASKIIDQINKNNTKFKIFKNKENYNLGGSHKVAFNYAIENNFKYIFVCQGDDQGEIEDLVNNFKKQKQDMSYFGSRFENKSNRINYDLVRTIGNIFFAKLFTIFLFKPISELGCGQSIFRVEDLKSKFYLNLPNDLFFTYYISMYFFMSNDLKHKYIPIKWIEFDQKSNLKPFKQSYNILKLLLGLLFFRKNYFKNKFSKIVKYEYNILVEK